MTGDSSQPPEDQDQGITTAGAFLQLINMPYFWIALFLGMVIGFHAGVWLARSTSDSLMVDVTRDVEEPWAEESGGSGAVLQQSEEKPSPPNCSSSLMMHHCDSRPWLWAEGLVDELQLDDATGIQRWRAVQYGPTGLRQFRFLLAGTATI